MVLLGHQGRPAARWRRGLFVVASPDQLDLALTDSGLRAWPDTETDPDA